MDWVDGQKERRKGRREGGRRKKKGKKKVKESGREEVSWLGRTEKYRKTSYFLFVLFLSQVPQLLPRSRE